VEDQIAAMNAHDAPRFAASFSEDAVLVDPTYPEPLHGRAAVEEDMASFLRTFPDLRMELTQTLVSGSSVAVEAVGTGTNTGPLVLPAGEIAPTGRSVRFAFAVFDTLDDRGLIAEERRYYDAASMMAQLGVGQQGAP
jgi:predicted ester cyclase